MKYISLKSAQNVSEMPIVGLGTWQNTEDTANIIYEALKIGYRHIDTAFHYNNENSIGEAIQKWILNDGGKREDLFITTKLPPYGNRKSDIELFVKESLKRLNLEYIDLYLIHHPFGFVRKENELKPVLNDDGLMKLDNDTNHLEIWEALESQVENGLVKHIGLSNFNENQIKNIYSNSKKIKPCLLQIEAHTYFQQKSLRKTCIDLGIALAAYSPLGSPGSKDYYINKYNTPASNFPDILGDPIIKQLAEKYQKTTSQLILRHLVQLNIGIVPKSTNSDRLKQNINLFDFELSNEDMEKMNQIDKGEQCRIFDFRVWKVENHPQYPF